MRGLGIIALVAACGSVSNNPDAREEFDGAAQIDAPSTPDAAAPACFALHFGGPDTRVRVASSNALVGGGRLTVEAWVRPTAGVIDPAGFYPNLIGKRNDNNIYPTWALGLNDTSKLYTVANGDWFYGTTGVVLNEWTHVAAVSDGAEVRFYINGALDSAIAATTQGPTNTEDVYIGTLPSNEQQYQGDIAGVRVSTVARYTSTFVPTATWTADPDTVLLLAMRDGTGTTATDSSGLGNDGRVDGATWIAECPRP